MHIYLYTEIQIYYIDNKFCILFKYLLSLFSGNSVTFLSSALLRALKVRHFPPLTAAGTMLRSSLSSSRPFLAGMWTALSWPGDKGQLGHWFWHSWPRVVHGGWQRELGQGRGSSWPQRPGSRVVPGGPAAPLRRAATLWTEVSGCTNGSVLGTNMTWTWSISARV